VRKFAGFLSFSLATFPKFGGHHASKTWVEQKSHLAKHQGRIEKASFDATKEGRRDRTFEGWKISGSAKKEGLAYKPQNVVRIECDKSLLRPCHDSYGCVDEARWGV
jgi:hypothetical protein